MAAVIRLIRDSSFKLSIVLGCCFLVWVGKGGVGYLVCVGFLFEGGCVCVCVGGGTSSLETTVCC